MGKAWIRVPRISIEMALAYGWGPCHLTKPLNKARIISARVWDEHLLILVESPELPKNTEKGVIPTYDPLIASERRPRGEPDGD